MAQVGKSVIRSVLTVLNPFVRAALFAYKGSNGLMLLSKYPLEEASVFDLADVSTLNRRGALMANVEVGGDRYQALCAHLASRLPNVPYTGELESWDEENKIQLTRLLAKTSDSLPVVFMGDFNCGLGSPEFALNEVLDASCRLPLNAGFSDHFANNDPECTYCSGASNTLNEGVSANILIDHIYVKGTSVVSSEIIFKEKVTVQTDEGEELLSNLSDHFGILIEVE